MLFISHKIAECKILEIKPTATYVVYKPFSTPLIILLEVGFTGIMSTYGNKEPTAKSNY